MITRFGTVCKKIFARKDEKSIVWQTFNYYTYFYYTFCACLFSATHTVWRHNFYFNFIFFISHFSFLVVPEWEGASITIDLQRTRRCFLFVKYTVYNTEHYLFKEKGVTIFVFFCISYFHSLFGCSSNWRCVIYLKTWRWPEWLKVDLRTHGCLKLLATSRKLMKIDN